MEETETEGCPLSYLRFGIVAHPILVILQSMARDRELVGLSLPINQIYAYTNINSSSYLVFRKPMRTSQR